MKNTPIIILNWNGWEDTFACLQSVARCQETTEVWLVDNASTDDRTAEAAELFPGLRIIQLEDNYGWAGGYNRALQTAIVEGFEFAYLLNNDTKVKSGFLSTALAVASEEEQLAAVGSLITYEGSPTYIKFDGAYHSPGTRLLQPGLGVNSVRHVNGAGMLVRLRAMQEHGYFDERFFCYGEETEWCWRMADSGWACMICMNSIITHKCEGSDIGSNAKYYRLRNRFLLLARLGYSKRLKARRQLVYHGAVQAQQAWSSRNFTEFTTISQAIDDGLSGRFGKRPIKSNRITSIGKMARHIAYAHLHDKWNSLRSLPTGYGQFSDQDLMPRVMIDPVIDVD